MKRYDLCVIGSGRPSGSPLSGYRKSSNFLLANKVRMLVGELTKSAPVYLKPSAQKQLLATPESCLAIIELAVNWEVEKLYGIEGGGPFDEF